MGEKTNFGSLDVETKAGTVIFRVRNFDKHGQPMSVLTRREAEELGRMLTKAKAEPEAPADDYDDDIKAVL